MTKRRKAPIAKTVLTRRARQAAAAAEAAAEALETANESNSSSVAGSTEDSNGSKEDSSGPAIASHKKFGKYRCLIDEGLLKVDCATVEATNDGNAASSDSSCSTPPILHDANSSDDTKSECQSPADRNLYPQQYIQDDNQDHTTSKDSKHTINVENLLGNSEQMYVFSESVTNPSQSESTESQEILQWSQEDPHNFDEEIITVVEIAQDGDDIENENNSEAHSHIRAFCDPSPMQQDLPEENRNVDAELLNKFQEKFTNLHLHLERTYVQSDSPSIEYSDTNDSLDIPGLECKTEVTTVVAPAGNNLLGTVSSLTEQSEMSPSVSEESDSSKTSKVINFTELESNTSSPDLLSSPSGVRRSDRIKTISHLKQRTRGRGVVPRISTPLSSNDSDGNSNSTDMLSYSPSFTVPSLDPDLKPVKVKSRWRRSSEMEMGQGSPVTPPLNSPNINARLQAIAESSVIPTKNKTQIEKIEEADEEKAANEKIVEERLKQFQHLNENDYLCERTISREAKKMTCDCFLTKEEQDSGEMGCGEDCLNRLLMIECNSRCPVGDRCTNRRFQKNQYGPLKVFRTEKKGFGLEAKDPIPPGEFLMEYVGEVLNSTQFYKRAQEYSLDKNRHHYFMALKGDAVIDATIKGNISRFINHSCDPNAETQKWTVNGELRIGFFSKRDVLRGEEITFDYHFQRYGKEAQRCYCEADNCRGWIGAEPDQEEEDSEEETEEEGEGEHHEQENVTTSRNKAIGAELCGVEDEKSQPETNSSVKLKSGSTSELPAKVRVEKRGRPRKYTVRSSNDIMQDSEIEEDLESLSRSGVKNQSHTLCLSRAMVRAKAGRARLALLRLLRDADLACRRLFLDYRGLRLLGPWCAHDAPRSFKLEMLQTLERLPVANRTMVAESRLFSIVERWRNEHQLPESILLIHQLTGATTENPEALKKEEELLKIADKEMQEKVTDLAKQLLERWSNLKEVFKIPKKERLQQMKEHEREANVERRAADSSGASRRREHRERNARAARPGTDPRSRLEDRTVTPVLSQSKEERRRAFAEAAARADNDRQLPSDPPTPLTHYPTHPPPLLPSMPSLPRPAWDMSQPPQMFGPPGMMGAPPGMMGAPPGMMGPPGMIGMPGMAGLMPPMVGALPQPDWMAQGDFSGPPSYCGPPFIPPAPFCMPPANFMMGPGGNFSSLGPMGPFMFPPGPGGPPGLSQPPPATPPPTSTAAPALPQVAAKTSQIVAKPPKSVTKTAPADVQIEEEKEVLLPSGWRSAVDVRGRTYYYHVRLRLPQWVPPPDARDCFSSDDDEEEDEDNVTSTQTTRGRLVEGVNGIYQVMSRGTHSGGSGSSLSDYTVTQRKHRPSLVSEVPISPRTEEDKQASKLEMKRYKETKEKLKRRKEKILLAAVKQRKHSVARLKSHKYKRKLKDTLYRQGKLKEVLEFSSDEDEEDEEAEEEVEDVQESISSTEEQTDEVDEDMARRIKEQFRSTMARVIVQHLNPYRHRDCTAGRITDTRDFKHLARKLTHFVMLKELKHCRSVTELECNDSVKQKAKEFIRKYMAKFGPFYTRPLDEED